MCAADEVGRTPLHWAAANGHVDVARELLIRGCPVDVADNKGCTMHTMQQIEVSLKWFLN